MFVAERLLAFRRAIPHLAWLPTLFATAIALPASGKVTGLTTILPATVAQSVRVHLGGLIASGANDHRGCGSHITIIKKYDGFYNVHHFDIACRRIEDEYRKPRLALPEPKGALQHDVTQMPAWIAFFLEGLA